MRPVKLFCLLALAIATSGTPVIYSQTVFEARAVASYRRGVMFRVHKMAVPEELAGCIRLVLVGGVESAERNARGEIVNFSLKARGGEKLTVNLPKSLYQQLPVEAEIGLSKLLSKGKRVRVVAYACGTSRDFLEADELSAL